MSENRRRRPQQPVQPVAAPRKKKKSKSKMKSYLSLLAMMAVVATISIGGTLAWLQDETKTVTNKFESSDISIYMQETVEGENKTTVDAAITNENFKMIPGGSAAKDPAVVVKANSEPSWVFVKVTENGGIVNYTENNTTKTTAFKDFITYELDGWTLVDGETNVYYKQQAATTQDTELNVLKDKTVKYPGTITKAMMNALTDETKPSLVFQAYAIQSDNLDYGTEDVEAKQAAKAWAIIAK